MTQQKQIDQIATAIREKIEQDVYKEKEKLPTDFELSRTFNVKRSIVQRAFHKLEEEGLIIDKYGVGRFVRSRPMLTTGIEKLSSVSSMIREAGMEPGTIYADVSAVAAEELDDEIFSLFTREDDEPIVVLKRIRTADGEPVVYCIEYALEKDLSMDATGVETDSLYEAIETNSGIPIDCAIAEIVPIGYHEEASSILRCGVDIPLLALIQRHYNENGEMVLHSTNYFRADKFRFQVVRKRQL